MIKPRLTVKNFMLNPVISIPPHYDAKRFCLLSYELPFLKYCFVICTHYQAHITTFSPTDFGFINDDAQRLSQQCVGNADCYLIIFSGQAIRRRENAHAHIFIVEKRWQKALVYSLLASKNWGLMFGNVLDEQLTRLSKH